MRLFLGTVAACESRENLIGWREPERQILNVAGSVEVNALKWIGSLCEERFIV